MHTRLIDSFKNIFNTRQIDDLNDVLTEDFYFRNPRIEIKGRDAYIQYVKGNQSLYTTETIRITQISEFKYKREYYLTFLDVSNNNNDKLHIIESLTIRDDLISSSIIEYDSDNVSDVTETILLKGAQNYGQSIK